MVEETSGKEGKVEGREIIDKRNEIEEKEDEGRGREKK